MKEEKMTEQRLRKLTEMYADGEVGVSCEHQIRPIRMRC